MCRKNPYFFNIFQIIHRRMFRVIAGCFFTFTLKTYVSLEPKHVTVYDRI